MRKVITGEQVAQIYNRDPFARPIWRAPVYQTPAGIILAVHLYRLLAWLVRLIARHPLAATLLALLALTWSTSAGSASPGWPPGSWWSWRPGGGSGRPRSPAG
jgi:hypothetical protein